MKVFLSGFIDLGDEVIYFEPYKNFKKSALDDEIIIYYQKDLIYRGHTCAANDTNKQKEHMTTKAHQLKSASTGCYVVEYVLLADFGMYVKHGNNTLNHIMSILNNVNNNFDNEFNDQITFSVVDDYIATNSSLDLWSSTNNANALLNEFSNSNFTNLPFDLVSLWVSRDIQRFSNFSVVGIAHQPGICSLDKKYNLIEDYSSAPQLEVLLAHEIGHNFNAGHDPSGSRTIMAPSVNITTTWSQNSQDVINAFYPSATCLCVSNNFIDLQISEDFCGLNLTASGINFYTGNVINTGDITAPQSTVGLFLSFDDEVNANDILIDEKTYSGFPPGNTNINIVLDLMTTGLPGGDYYLGFIADIYNQVSEIEENNNARICGSKITIPTVCSTDFLIAFSESILEAVGDCPMTVTCLQAAVVDDPNPGGSTIWSTGSTGEECLSQNGFYALTVTNGSGCQQMFTYHINFDDCP